MVRTRSRAQRAPRSHSPDLRTNAPEIPEHDALQHSYSHDQRVCQRHWAAQHHTPGSKTQGEGGDNREGRNGVRGHKAHKRPNEERDNRRQRKRKGQGDGDKMRRRRRRKRRTWRTKDNKDKDKDKDKDKEDKNMEDKDNNGPLFSIQRNA